MGTLGVVLLETVLFTGGVVKSVKYLALIAPVPETREYLLPGVGGAGNLAHRGIAEGLYKIDPTCKVAGFWGMRSWPHANKLLILPRRIEYASSLKVTILAEINLPFVREMSRFCASLIYILGWSARHLASQRVILIYNYSVPPLLAVVVSAILTRSRIVPIVFDVGADSFPKKASLFGLVLYLMESFNRRLMQMVAGAAVIVAPIQKKLFPQKTSLLIDGGVSPEIQCRLFDLNRDEESNRHPATKFLLAGSLCGYNGIDLALSAMSINRDERIRLIIAGGCDEEVNSKITAAMSKDDRIEYRGRLSLDELFLVYREIDVFLNLRMTKSYNMSYFFPSKFLEALTVGRYVVTTDVAHLKAVYGHLCHVLSNEDPQCLADALSMVADMSRAERDKMGSNGRRFMLEHHTWQQQMERYVEYCHRLIAGEYKTRSGMVEVTDDRNKK